MVSHFRSIGRGRGDSQNHSLRGHTQCPWNQHIIILITAIIMITNNNSNKDNATLAGVGCREEKGANQRWRAREKEVFCADSVDEVNREGRRQ